MNPAHGINNKCIIPFNNPGWRPKHEDMMVGMEIQNIDE